MLQRNGRQQTVARQQSGKPLLFSDPSTGSARHPP
jgi:hypothetical protein